MRFPNTVDDLLAQMDLTFPEVLPEPGQDQSEIMFNSGRRSVVNYLKQWRATASRPPSSPRQRGQGRNVRREDT